MKPQKQQLKTTQLDRLQNKIVGRLITGGLDIVKAEQVARFLIKHRN